MENSTLIFFFRFGVFYHYKKFKWRITQKTGKSLIDYKWYLYKVILCQLLTDILWLNLMYIPNIFPSIKRTHYVMKFNKRLLLFKQWGNNHTCLACLIYSFICLYKHCNMIRVVFNMCFLVKSQAPTSFNIYSI